MAITIDGKVYRNLEEQVEKNKKDIAEFKEQAQSLSQFGIKVVSQVQAVGLIPEVIAYKAAHSDWEYGDTYAVGTQAPYTLYILTRADEDDHPEDYWFNIGQFPVAGPTGAQGPTGETGAQGTRGSIWSVGTSFPTSANIGDMFLYSTSSTVYQWNGTQWESKASIKGSQGIQGIQGPQGETGPQGPQGIQGIQGPVGGTFTIKDSVASESLLPDPATSPRNEAYLIEISGVNHIYIIIDDEEEGLTWFDAGQFTGSQGPQGPAGPQGIQGVKGDTGSGALVCNTRLQASFTYGGTTNVYIQPANLNRVAVVGEQCIVAIENTGGQESGIAVVTITSVSDALVQGTFSTQYDFIDLRGAEGPQGEMGALNSSSEITYDSTTQSCLLASTVRNKINSALQTPSVAPTNHYLVGIDSTNAQENISIGSGLELTNGALNATGGGYTAGQNISISSAGVISIPGTQSGTGSVAIVGTAIGGDSTALGIFSSANAAKCTAIGKDATASKSYSVAIGQNAQATQTATLAIGRNSAASIGGAIAIGSSDTSARKATSSAVDACQIGGGTNSVANSLQFRSTQIVDTNGKIATTNLAGPTGSDGTYTLKCVRANGVNTIQWVLDT